MRASPKKIAFVGMALFPKKNRPKAVKKIEVVLVRGMLAGLLPLPIHGPIDPHRGCGNVTGIPLELVWAGWLGCMIIFAEGYTSTATVMPATSRRCLWTPQGRPASACRAAPQICQP